MFSYLRQSTASQARIVGPFVDDTAFTAETGLSIANTDVKLSKNGGASVNKNSGGGTHIANGTYSLTFDATDTNTVGELSFSISMSGALIVVGKFWVLEEPIYDALFAANAAGFDANQRVNVGSWLGTAVTANDIAIRTTLAKTTHITGFNDVSTAQVNAEVDTALSDIGLDHLLAASVAGADVVDNSVVAKLVSSSATADWDTYDNTTDSQQATRDSIQTPLDAAGVRSAVGLVSANLDTQLAALPTAAENADAVWEEAIADHSGTVGSTAEALDAAGGGVTVGAIADAVWDEALAGHLVAGSTGEALNAAGASGDPWTTTLPGAYTGSQAGKVLADVLVDTADIQPKLGTITDLGSGATIGANLVDIEAQTDDIGTAGAGLTAIPWNAAWDTEVQSEVQDAIEVNHLDHLLAADYDPASKPGVSTALLNELVENDAGVSRFTANALEQAPTGGSAPTAAAIADAVWEEAIADHSGTVGSVAEALDAAGGGSTPSAIAAAVHQYVVESGNPSGAKTFEEITRIVLAAMAGVSDTNYDWGAKNPAGTKTRLGGTLDSSGRRTAVTKLDGS